MLREIGARFVRAGAIEEKDHVFWLTTTDVENTIRRMNKQEQIENLSGMVSKRKAIWRAARRAAPPTMLPHITLFKTSQASGAKEQKGSLKGVAASPGWVTAPACVLEGPEDFAKFTTGDVLVASLTTPAWTPLFARASAVVTDIGGPLSHGSIVAREYGIPAVLGTGSATTQIRNGQMITVDGDKGMIHLIPNP